MNNSKEIEEDLKKVADLAVLSETEGGKQLIAVLTTDLIEGLDLMLANRDTYTLQQFVAGTCDLKTRLDVIRSIARAKTNKELLEELLKESLAQ